jgi:hypothetical protein
MNAGKAFVLSLIVSVSALAHAEGTDFDQRQAYRIVSGKTTRAEAEALLGPAHAYLLGVRGRTLVWEYRTPQIRKSVVLIIDEHDLVRDVRLSNAQSL